MAINENYTKTRAVTLLPTTPTANQSMARRGSKGDVLHVLRPADSLQHNHKNKKRCLDYQGHTKSWGSYYFLVSFGGGKITQPWERKINSLNLSQHSFKNHATLDVLFFGTFAFLLTFDVVIL